MTAAELRKIKAKSNNKQIPHLKTVNGKAEIDSSKPDQVKWFKAFKK